MNQLLDRILDRIKLTDIIDIIGILSITLSAVVATAESVSLNLPAWATFFVLLAIVFLRGVETWLKRRLASEPSPEQEDEILRLQLDLSTTAVTLDKRNKELIAAYEENKRLRAEKESVTLASQQWAHDTYQGNDEGSNE